ncbi:hypothetical protein [Litchfieldia alkalitelluris]|uniref:hypothetical protein n=1 Tax=Litchfieldia alkalitelluris TaxID=304268 RepID=UPI001F1A7A0C|nr:hypothetical protein [Litchfieldia alkalitelluris]
MKEKAFEQEEEFDQEEEFEEEEEFEQEEDLLLRQLEGLLGESILVVTESPQLNLLGQSFRPIFCGPIVEVETGHLTIYPATIKLLNAPFYKFPTPLSIPFEKMAHFTPKFDCNARIPLI